MPTETIGMAGPPVIETFVSVKSDSSLKPPTGCPVRRKVRTNARRGEWVLRRSRETPARRGNDRYLAGEIDEPSAVGRQREITVIERDG